VGLRCRLRIGHLSREVGRVQAVLTVTTVELLRIRFKLSSSRDSDSESVEAVAAVHATAGPPRSRSAVNSTGPSWFQVRSGLACTCEYQGATPTEKEPLLPVSVLWTALGMRVMAQPLARTAPDCLQNENLGRAPERRQYSRSTGV
jgi:hypothetical protein